MMKPLVKTVHWGVKTASDVVLLRYLKEAIKKLNPDADIDAVSLAIEEITKDRSSLNILTANKEIYQLLKDGVSVTYRDEYDEDEEEPIREIQPGREYEVLGSAKLDDVNEALGTKLESEDYDSVGGYIIEQLDCLPKEGQSVTLESGIRLVVDRLDKNRIELVHIWLPEKKPKQKNSRNCHLSSISENCFTILESSPVTASIPSSFFLQFSLVIPSAFTGTT